MTEVVLEETYVPSSFEDYIERVSEEREGKFHLALWMSILSILGPILIAVFLLQYLVFINVNLWIALSSCFSVCVGLLYALHEWQRRTISYLQGRQMLILTFRLRSGFSFQDYALIKNVKKLKIDNNLTNKLKPLFPYEVEFEDFPFFDKLIVYSPCDWDGLLQFMPSLVLWKMFITTASAALISVVRLKEYNLGDEGMIPHVYPTDSDYEADKWLSIAGTLNITPESIASTQKAYEEIKYMEMEMLYEGSQRQLETLKSTMKKVDVKAAEMAGELYAISLETGTQPKLSKLDIMSWIRKNRKWILIGIGVLVVFFIMYGGYFFR